MIRLLNEGVFVVVLVLVDTELEPHFENRRWELKFELVLSFSSLSLLVLGFIIKES